MKHILISLMFLTSLASASGEAEGGKERIGPGKAVIAADEKSGFKLSDKAIKNLMLQFMPVTSSNLTVSSTALVRFQDFIAIYRYRDGWFRMVEIEPKFQNGLATFSSKELQPGDQVIIQNGSLLRVVELDVFGPEADACVD